MNALFLTEGQFPVVSRLNIRLYWLAKKLAEKGNSVFFLSPSDNPFSFKSGSFEGINFFQFPGFAKSLHGKLVFFVRAFHFVSSVVAIFFLARKKKIDFFHAWNPLTGFSAAIASKLAGKPFFFDFTDFYSDIARKEVPLLAGFFEWMESFVLKSAKAVFVVSAVMKQRLSEKGVDGKKIFIVEDGTDTALFKPDRKGAAKMRKRYCLPAGKTVVFHGGDIKYADGADLLLKSFSIVLKKIPDAKLLVVGGREKELLELKKISSGLSISDSVVFTGFLPKAEVPQCLSAASIGAMPLRATLNHECYLSFKIFEYWACGKPVVVSRLKAISAIAKQNQNALLCPAEDIACFAESIVFLMKKPVIAKRLGGNGKKMVVARFDWRKLMEKEAKIVESFFS